MKWIRERDSLIAQTMAFVQTVAGKKDEAAPRAVTIPPAHSTSPQLASHILTLH